jgi:hypothetical protein
MRRPIKRLQKKLSADSQRLITLAQGIAVSSSRLEERAWERNMDTLLQKMLKHEHQDIIESALDHLFKSDPNAYDALMESVEAGSESCRIEHHGKQYDALLVAAPILAWTRFTIASGPINPDMQVTLTAHLNAHLLAPGVRLALAPTLFSIDQLPRSFAETYALTNRLAQAALTSTAPGIEAGAPETAQFLADTRYLLAVIVVPAEGPIFRWQASNYPTDREIALSQWQTQAMPNITKLLPGCGIELILPEAYYIACREADKQIRPVSIRSAVNYLIHSLNIEPDQLRVVIGKFGDTDSEGRIDEYRISFLRDQNPDVIYGIVWPLYGVEDGESDSAIDSTDEAAQPCLQTDAGEKSPIEEIQEVLQELGLIHVKTLNERFSMEFCDDCSAPLFPDTESELVHAEMPEDVELGTAHFH